MSGRATRPGDDGHFHGRRRGKKLRPHRSELIRTLLPRLALPVPALPAQSPPIQGRFWPSVRPGACGGGLLAPSALFGRQVSSVWLEIGFGAGEHLAAQAEARPDIGFIGAEPFINGVAALLSRIEARGLENVRILADDVRPLLYRLAPGSIGRAFILFPDPWPKPRHHRRRIVNGAVLDALARVLSPGAELRLATDHLEYARWMLAALVAHPDFEWTARRAADWRERPADWPATRYEAKARKAGLAPVFLRMRRRPTA